MRGKITKRIGDMLTEVTALYVRLVGEEGWMRTEYATPNEARRAAEGWRGNEIRIRQEWVATGKVFVPALARDARAKALETEGEGA